MNDSKNCPICKCDLGHLDFEAVDQDTEVSEDVFRLKCGHAFHTTCLCHALRVENRCPTCRNGVDSEVQELQIVLGPDGLLTISHNDDIQLPDFNVDEARQVSSAINSIRSDFQLQKLRRRANIHEKRYRALEQELMFQRSAMLKEALSKFRYEYRAIFEKEKRGLRAIIKKVRLYEIQKLSEMPEISALDYRKYLDFNLDSRVGTDFGPLKTRFWV